MTHFGRQLLTLLRPGEQRKNTCPAAKASRTKSGFKVLRSHSFHVERRRIPAPVFRSDGNPPHVERRHSPAPQVGQMETT